MIFLEILLKNILYKNNTKKEKSLLLWRDFSFIYILKHLGERFYILNIPRFCEIIVNFPVHFFY
ncbi:hypothetical protein DXD66_10355 [Fusobacterium varium]|jgi:hypothetical protein|nr:hypothetical protein DXD66_10355 [Fusobacterium varium]